MNKQLLYKYMDLIKIHNRDLVALRTFLERQPEHPEINAMLAFCPPRGGDQRLHLTRVIYLKDMYENCPFLAGWRKKVPL